MGIKLPEKGKKVNEAVNAPVEETSEAPAEAVEETAEAAERDISKYGSKRETLAFKRPLGNPADKDTTKFRKKDGTEDEVTRPTIVGGVFECLEDMKVPDFGTTEKFREDPMDYKDLNNWKDAKKGEEVYLTPFEIAVLLSQPEFNGGCDGGEYKAYCVYSKKTKPSKAGAMATVGAASKTPRVALRLQEGSIKSLEYEDVLTVEMVSGPNGTKRKIKTLKEGEQYQKWAPLAVNSVGKSARAGSKKAADSKRVNENAEMFLKFVYGRKAK